MVHVLLSDCPTCGRPLVGTSGYEVAAVTVRCAWHEKNLAVIFYF